MTTETQRASGQRTGEAGTAYRDAACARMDASWAGREVTLAGWVHRRRDLGGVHFVDLRDASGVVQVAFKDDWTEEAALRAAGELGPEDVVQVEGEVVRRPEDAVNPEMETGEVEVHVRRLRRLTAADDLPVLVAVPPEESLPSEELRLRHRYLDLRRPEMHEHLRVRHRAVQAARAALDAEGFTEVETPLLTRRTPEGARDFVVPSREHPGQFYALPQSPQLYKQLLMASGVDRYYQVAKCLRDEDLRADRQPEFTQVDVEMAFVDEEDVFGVCERMLARMWSAGAGVELDPPFPRLTHAEALDRFGTDKPDLRIPWEIRDLTDLLTGIGFRIFDGAADAGGRVRGLVLGPEDGGGDEPPARALSRSDLDDLDDLAQEAGAKGVLWLRRRDGAWSGPPAGAVEDSGAGEALRREHGAGEEGLVLLVAGPDAETSPALDALRREAAARLDAVDRDARRWAWVTDFPMFEPDPETGRPVPAHHPFTLPDVDDPDRLREAPLEVSSRAYDVVYNGHELCSGSLRCHDPDLQRAILDVLGIDHEAAEERFGFLLEAFRHGVPPHGGYALGLDRTVMLMVGASSIRDVIAFPKTTAGRALLEGAPSPVEASELRELGLRTTGTEETDRT